MSFQDNPEFYIGQNISVLDKQNDDGTFSTIFNAPNTTIVDSKEITDNLIVNTSADFKHVIINNIGDGILETDAVNLGQLTTLVNTRIDDVETKINKSILDISNKLVLITDCLNSEISRAVASEQVLTTNLDSEISRAIAAEQVSITNLSSEVSRAVASEQVLTTNLNSEVSRAIDSDQFLTSNLNSEVTRAMTSEELITDNLTLEVKRAITSEQTIINKLNELTTRVDYIFKHFFKNQNMGKS